MQRLRCGNSGESVCGVFREGQHWSSSEEWGLVRDDGGGMLEIEGLLGLVEAMVVGRLCAKLFGGFASWGAVKLSRTARGKVTPRRGSMVVDLVV